MAQFDWPGLVRGALWIIGLSVALAAWSYASWWAASHGAPVRAVLGLPLFVVPFFAGLALFCAGLAWSMDSLVLRVLWIVAGLGCLWVAAQAGRSAGAHKSFTQEEPDETH
jgi:hypothetical protein